MRQSPQGEGRKTGLRRVDVWAMMPVRAYAPPANADDCAAAPTINNFGQTSGGSGFAAGIVCLMRAVNPALTPADIRAAMRVRELNFHTPDDIDYFSLDLPDEALDDCRAVPEDCPFEFLRSLFNGRLIIRVIGAHEIIKLDSQGQELERDDNYLEYDCYETGDRAYFAVVGCPDRSLDYEIQIEYSLPDDGMEGFFGDLCHAWRDQPPPDPHPDSDGFYVVNPGKANPQEFWLGLPCSPIVCDPPLYDYLMFNWNQSDRFNIEFQHADDDNFAFELLDTQLNVLGRAERLPTPQGPAPADNGAMVTDRLTVELLPAGFYLLRATGEQAGNAYTVRFLTTAAPTLMISPSAVDGSIALSWTVGANPAVLEETASLEEPVPWSPVSAAPQEVNGVMNVTLPTGTGSRFFRLRTLA